MIALLLLVTAVGGPSDASPELTEMRGLFDDLECEKLLDKAGAFLASSTDKAVAEVTEVRFRQGYCLAVVGNITDATKVFEALVRDDPEIVQPFDMEPRIQYLVDAARNARRAELGIEEIKARRALQASVKLLVHEPLNIVGGQRATFNVELTDPDHAVKSMRIDFVKAGEREPYGIPFLKQKDGTWSTTIPGSFTRSTEPLHIRWYITASDDAGDLARVGTRAKPRVLDVAPGSEVALDMRASERFSKPARFTYALIGVPAITTAFFLGGLALSGGTCIVVEHSGGDTPRAPASLGERAGVVLLAVLPPVGAVVGTGISTQFLLDDSEPWVPTGAVIGAGAIYALGVFSGGADIVRSFKSPPKSGSEAANRVGLFGGLAAAGAGLGLVASAVVPATMVGYENAVE